MKNTIKCNECKECQSLLILTNIIFCIEENLLCGDVKKCPEGKKRGKRKEIGQK